MRRAGWALLGAVTAAVVGHVVAGCSGACASKSELAPGTYVAASAPVGLDGYTLVVDPDFAQVHERFSIGGHAHERTWNVPVVHHYDNGY